MANPTLRTDDSHGTLQDLIAVVAGATRGAGRGIARALGEAGATVYCTGRSQQGNPSDYGRPETIEETADLVTAAGGHGIPIRVDHSEEQAVRDLFNRIETDNGRLDILVDSVAGEHPLLGTWSKFWETDLSNAPQAIQAALLPRLITAKHAAPLMIKNKTGLIVEVTEGDLPAGVGNNILQSLTKAAIKHLVFKMAEELQEHHVTAVAITPGYLRSEAILEHWKVSETNWKDAGKQDENFLESESPLFVGRAVVAVAQDPERLNRSGDLLSSWGLGREFGFCDADGRRPDWGKHGETMIRTYDFVAQSLKHQAAYLERMAERANNYLGPSNDPASASGSNQ